MGNHQTGTGYAYELDVTEICASLKSARVKVIRTIPEATLLGKEGIS
jgi:hypothetical protein